MIMYGMRIVESNCHCEWNEVIQKTWNNLVNGLLHTSQWQHNEIHGRFPTSREWQLNIPIDSRLTKIFEKY
jgi:hypothetical protein